MKISVVVLTYFPVWNTVRLTLESILAQNMDDYEIVVSDDGSDNNRFDQIEALFKERGFSDYQLLPHKNNQGTVKNIIDAVESARGKYIRCFGQGDLFYDENSLENICSFMEQRQSRACFGLMQGFSVSEEKTITKHEFPHPFDIRAYETGDGDAIARNLILYRDNASGASTTFEKQFYLHYLKKLEGRVKYTEDILHVMAGADGEVFDFYPDYIVWYEMAVGVSTTKKSKFAELLAKDVDSFYEFLYETYPDNKYVKKQKSVSGLYRIRNLYVRTMIRCIVNPDAVRYLTSHWMQMKTGAYRPHHDGPGFLDTDEFRNML